MFLLVQVSHSETQRENSHFSLAIRDPLILAGNVLLDWPWIQGNLDPRALVTHTKRSQLSPTGKGPLRKTMNVLIWSKIKMLRYQLRLGSPSGGERDFTSPTGEIYVQENKFYNLSCYLSVSVVYVNWCTQVVTRLTSFWIKVIVVELRFWGSSKTTSQWPSCPSSFIAGFYFYLTKLLR